MCEKKFNEARHGCVKNVRYMYMYKGVHVVCTCTIRVYMGNVEPSVLNRILCDYSEQSLAKVVEG